MKIISIDLESYVRHLNKIRDLITSGNDIDAVAESAAFAVKAKHMSETILVLAKMNAEKSKKPDEVSDEQPRT